MAAIPINNIIMSELNKEYEASLKSIETENVVDRVFYRPIGFQIARLLRGTGITPNMVIIMTKFRLESIFFSLLSSYCCTIRISFNVWLSITTLEDFS